jgi:hypothetical protein
MVYDLNQVVQIKYAIIDEHNNFREYNNGYVMLFDYSSQAKEEIKKFNKHLQGLGTKRMKLKVVKVRQTIEVIKELKSKYM